MQFVIPLSFYAHAFKGMSNPFLPFLYPRLYTFLGYQGNTIAQTAQN